MPHLLNHRSTIALSCFTTARSTRSFCPTSSVGLRRPPPHRVITTPTFGGNINGENRTIICMANPRRVKMVAKQIRRELSDMLLTDKVLQYAVLPEAALGADRYLSSLTTISDVEVSADLQVVKVYVSVFGDERGKEVALAGLKSKAKYVRGELGKRMKLRLTPEVRFLEDESLERGSRVIAILDKIKDENEKKTTKDGDNETGEFADGSNDDVEWEGDGVDDEGIIYVN
ncbi:probable ribosome-binding factor a chloroplastic [Phtheirospermum japonicum]|uniref:Probable ribosome-binding factor a chloroplastic n=1 Tax=Phtheirospermum japonicum TaxID=374723 RepID=A0A830BVL9_9LAMI|nr:probable ribosome-binding factor a chloroplastic [Phtheirospermum japonicum]